LLRRRLRLGDEHAQPLGQSRRHAQPAADPQVVARAQFGVHDADQRDVVDLVHHIEAGVAGDRTLELARQVRDVGVADEPLDDLIDHRRGVDDLVGGDAGHGGAQHHPGAVAAGLGGDQPDRLEPAPDLGHVFDPDPVQLHVLPV
jgi:hypothetical protein